MEERKKTRVNLNVYILNCIFRIDLVKVQIFRTEFKYFKKKLL